MSLFSQLPKWSYALGLRKGIDFTAGSGSSSQPEGVPAKRFDEAQTIISKIELPNETNKHKPVLDLDFPAELIASSTPGHFHLYLDKELPWGKYEALLRALADADIIERGYCDASIARGYTAVRLPWVRKTDEERAAERRAAESATEPYRETVDRVAEEAPATAQYLFAPHANSRSTIQGASANYTITDEVADWMGSGDLMPPDDPTPEPGVPQARARAGAVTVRWYDDPAIIVWELAPEEGVHEGQRGHMSLNQFHWEVFSDPRPTYGPWAEEHFTYFRRAVRTAVPEDRRGPIRRLEATRQSNAINSPGEPGGIQRVRWVQDPENLDGLAHFDVIADRAYVRITARDFANGICAAELPQAWPWTDPAFAEEAMRNAPETWVAGIRRRQERDAQYRARRTARAQRRAARGGGLPGDEDYLAEARRVRDEAIAERVNAITEQHRTGPQPGDIAIVPADGGAQYGHTAIVGENGEHRINIAPNYTLAMDRAERAVQQAVHNPDLWERINQRPF